MHYLRFLKAPKIHLREGQPEKVASTISITTDLSDLYYPESVEIEAQVVEHAAGSNPAHSSRQFVNGSDQSSEHDDGRRLAASVIGANIFIWKGRGQRALPIEVAYRRHDPRDAKTSKTRGPLMSSPKARNGAGVSQGEDKTGYYDDGGYQLYLQLNAKDSKSVSILLDPPLIVEQPGRGIIHMPMIIPVTMKAVLDQPPTARQRITAPVFAERLLNFQRRCLKADNQAEYDASFKVLEETGHSIARHVWDSGLALIANMDLHPCVSSPSPSQVSQFHEHSAVSDPSCFANEDCDPWEPSPNGRLPVLDRLLANHVSDHGERLRVLELGAGTGSVGLWFKHRFVHSTVLLTDLPDAQEIAEANIEALLSKQRYQCISHISDKDGAGIHKDDDVNKDDDDDIHCNHPRSDQADIQNFNHNANLKQQGEEHERGRLEFCALDWAQPALPMAYADQAFDLIIASDCIYNTDSIPLLVSALRAVSKQHPFSSSSSAAAASFSHGADAAAAAAKAPAAAPLILIATKRRHASEAIFFELMSEAGFRVLQRATVASPMSSSRSLNTTTRNSKAEYEEREHEQIHLFLYTATAAAAAAS